ncbi:hypothetical protein VNI00_012483 [Paramarasmius palmivorus]|uniref:Uncharacterized protein n=1 Tax=Paramarasmius palmivorus TaxID=297713 RepID=A0AAW0C645_9AGAR
MAGQKKKANTTAPATAMTVAEASAAYADAKATCEALQKEWEAHIAQAGAADRRRGRAKEEHNMKKTKTTEHRYNEAVEEWKIKKGLAEAASRKLNQAKKLVGVYKTARTRAMKREGVKAAEPSSPALSELSDLPDGIQSEDPSQTTDLVASANPSSTGGDDKDDACTSTSNAHQASAADNDNSIAAPSTTAGDNGSDQSAAAPLVPEKPPGSEDGKGGQANGSNTNANDGPTRKRTGSDTQAETRPQKKAKGVVNNSDPMPMESTESVKTVAAEVPSNDGDVTDKQMAPATAQGKSGKKTKPTPNPDANAVSDQSGPPNGKNKGKGKGKGKGKAAAEDTAEDSARPTKSSSQVNRGKNKAPTEDEDDINRETNDPLSGEVPPRTIKSAKNWLLRCKKTAGPSSIPKVSQGLTTYVLKHSSTIPEAATSSWEIALAALTSQKGFAKCRFHTQTEKTTGRRFDNDKELYGTPWPGVTKAMKAANDNNAVGREDEDASSSSEDEKEKEPDIREMDPLHCVSWSPWWWKRVKGRHPKALDCGCDVDDVLLDFYLFKTGKLTSPTMARTEGWNTDWVRPRQRALYLASWREGTKLTVYDCYSMVSVKGHWKHRDPADITNISISRMQISVGLPVTVTLPSWSADADPTPGSPVKEGSSGKASAGRKMLKYIEIDED